MPVVTFQVIDGINKGRVFRDLATPLTIGREEGNLLRLDDERVSRFHAKVQSDNDEIILTDMESTNGTKVNGVIITIRRLKIGDQIGIGRSVLLFGSEEQILNRANALNNQDKLTSLDKLSATVHAALPDLDQELDFDAKEASDLTIQNGNLYLGNRPLPQLPARMTPSQTARLSELLEFLHGHLIRATENISSDEKGEEVRLPYGDWQKVLKVQMLLARYLRAISEPDSLQG